MNATVKYLNRTMLLALAPFIGILLWLLLTETAVVLTGAADPAAETVPSAPANIGMSEQAKAGLEQAHGIAVHTRESIQREMKLYNQTNAEIKEIAELASAQAQRPLAIYDRKITGKLGKPSATIHSDKLRAQLFYLQQDLFKGYAVKIKLKSDDAMQMVMGGDELGEASTTLEAVKRHKAAVGVNAGGFADSRGKRYPLSTTVLDGKYVNGFEASYKDLFFVGLNENNKLIGGKFTAKEQLDAKKPKFGASFVPVLLRNGRSQTIPDKWKKNPRRAPRTVIANYKDDQLLILVTDGYNEAGSSGATLEELQSMLKNFGAVDAYNLDGGGSSSLVFNGKVINKPSDGSLRKLPTHFLFFK